MKMKAVYLAELGCPLIVDSNVEVPSLREGQVLVKLAFSGVCHSQLMEVSGGRGEDKYLPHMLGHEGSGKVCEVGPGVTKVKVDDSVVLTWIKGAGKDAGGTQYRSGTKQINAGAVTTFMEYAVISENRCVLLPDGVPLDAAALLGCAVPTGAGIVINTIHPKAGTDIAVWGLGGIGLSALLATRAFRFNRVIAIDVSEQKLALAREFGATHAIHATEQNVQEQVRELTNGVGVDYCVEAAGLSKTIEGAFGIVRRNGGLCVFASHPQLGDKISIDPFELICGKKIQGSWGGECLPDRDIPRFVDLFRKGIFPFPQLLSHRYPLEGVNQALDDLKSRKITRALLEISP